MRKFVGYTLLFSCTFFVFLYLFQFDDTITSEDISYCNLLLSNNHIDTSAIHNTLKSEIDFIKGVQHAVQSYAETKNCIPESHTRDIKDLYDYHCGLCYDKSHVIEKILRIYDFETRHISMYFYKEWYEKFWILFIPKSGSHAYSEVKTKGGWMLVDSLTNIMGLTEGGEILATTRYKKLVEEGTIKRKWAYGKKSVFLYGVYSRNGNLYPPYNFVPDYRFHELWYNIVP